MFTTISVPLRFAPRTGDPSSLGVDASPLVYDLEPAGRQARLQNRLALIPRIDLSAYRCRAAIDWIWLEFETVSTTQSRWVRERVVPITRESVLVTGPDEPHDVEKPRNVTGTHFRMKLHDPEPGAAARMLKKLRSSCGLAAPVRIIGIEIALDWYPKDGSDQARWEMVAALQRAHLPRFAGLDSPDADLRHLYEKPDPRPVFIVQDRRKPSSIGRDAGRRLSDLELGQEEVRQRILRVEGHRAPFIDSIVCRSLKDGPVLFRIQNKVTDKRKPAAGTFEDLPPGERRARVEVMLLEDAVAAVGIGTLGNLPRFRFRSLRVPLFPLMLATVPGGGTADSSLASTIARQRGKTLCGVFKESGVYGVDLYEAAIEADQKISRKERRAAGEEVAPMRRLRPGKNRASKVWEEAARAADNALDRLSADWARVAAPKKPSSAEMICETVEA